MDTNGKASVMSSKESMSPWIHLSVPHMGENEARYVNEAFSENWISTIGPNIERFESLISDRLDAHVVALSSGTAAIHLALRTLGIKTGDEIVVPSLTFAGTCNPVLYQAANPVFLDCGEHSMNIDANLLRSFLKGRAEGGRLPAAIIVVHLFGESADMNPIMELSETYEIPVIEDAAEALGSTYEGQECGTIGTLGVFSFNGNKIITTSGGGALVGSERSQIEFARKLSMQARDPDPADLGDYWHSEIGYNYRMSNVLAGIGCGQLEVLDQRIRQRQSVAGRYEDAFRDLPGLSLIRDPGYGIHTRWLSCFLVDEGALGISRDKLIRYLRKHHVDCRPVWKPLHTQPVYSHYETIGGENSERFNQLGLCLPSSSSLSENDQDRVVNLILEARRNSVG